MIQKSQMLLGAREPALSNSPVSFPVVTGKKLIEKKVVGDFSFIPTTAMELLQLVGSSQLQGIRVPIGTKSAKKGWRLTAKW